MAAAAAARLLDFLAGRAGALPEGVSAETFLSRMLFSTSHHDVSNLDHQQVCQILASYGPRQVCQYQFKTNDIVWICKQCQKDETCVLCNTCFQQSCHDGHDVYFYHSAAGGCCDCGDADAWDSRGFCGQHGKRDVDPVQFLPQSLQEQAKAVFSILADSIQDFFQNFALIAEIALLDMEEGETYSFYVYSEDMHSAMEIVNFAISGTVLRMMGCPPIERSDQLLNKRGYLKLASGLPAETFHVMTQQFRQLGFLTRILSSRMERQHDAVLEALSWMRSVSLACDGICSLACRTLSTARLRFAIQADMYLDKQLGAAFHNLLLSLMADQSFKMTAAVAYALSYRKLCRDFGNNLGVNGLTMFTLSVQFLNREFFVSEISYHREFLHCIVQALYDMIHIYPSEHFSTSGSITRRRYSPIIGDLKIVFAISEIARLFQSQCLNTFLQILEEMQLLHTQKRAFDAHVLYEDRNWTHAFNLTLGFGSLFDYLVNWFSDPSSSAIVHRTTVSLTDQTKSEPTVVQLTDVRSVVEKTIHSCFQWSRQCRENVYVYNSAEILHDAIDLESCDLLSPSQQHIILSYFSLSFNHSEARSFHLPLHRFLSYMILECCKFPHLTPTLHDIMQRLRENRKMTLATMFSVLQPLLFSCEIRQGKWKRNGSCVYDQLLNYSEAPYSRVYQELDMGLLQTSLIVLPASVLLIYLFNESCIIKIMLQDALEVVGASLPVEPDFTAGMIAQCLQLLIHAVTELPAKPSADTFERCRRPIRKMWIHRLASEACTYSQLHENMNLIPDIPKLPTSDLDALLMEIAVKNQTSMLSSPTYSLRRELWVEYDPCYPHINASAHQAAMDRKPKLTSNQPIVLAPEPAHECYEKVRAKVLFDFVLLQTVRNILHSAAWKRLQHEEYERQQLLDVAYDCNDNVFSRVLHILTLAVHEAKAMTASGNGGSVVLQSFYKNLVFERAVSIEAHEGHVSRLNPSTFRTLYRLRAWYEEIGEINYVFNIGWLLNELCALSPDCQAAMNELQPRQLEASVQAASSVPAGTTDFEQLKKINRDKALQSMQSAAQAFLDSLEDISDDESDEMERNETVAARGSEGSDTNEDNTENHDAQMDVGAKASVELAEGAAHNEQEEDVEEQLCIICQTELDQSDEDAEAGSFVGCLGLVQCSTLGHPKARGFYVADTVSKVDRVEINRGKWNASNLRVGLCGHMMHSLCFEAFRSSQHSTSAVQNMIVLDTSQGYVTCPLCKKLCNVLIPMQPAKTYSSAKIDRNGSADSCAEVRWLRGVMDYVDKMNQEGVYSPHGTLDRYLQVSPTVPANDSASKLFLASAVGEPELRVLPLALETVLCMLSYTISMDITEHTAPGYHLPAVQQLMEPLVAQAVDLLGYGKYSPGFDDLRKFHVAVEALGQASQVDGVACELVQQLLTALASTKFTNRRGYANEGDRWLGHHWPPLLQLPLLDVAILTLVLQSLNGDIVADCEIPVPEIMNHTASLANTLPWVVLAKLVQLCVDYRPPSSRAEPGAASTSTSATDTSSSPPSAHTGTQDRCIDPSEWPQFSALLETLFSCGVVSRATPDSAWRSILLDWVLFMRILLHVLTRCPGSSQKAVFLDVLHRGDPRWALLPLTVSTVDDHAVANHLLALDMSFLVSPSSPHLAVSANDWNEVGCLISRWQSDQRTYLELGQVHGVPRFAYSACGRYSSYPRSSQQQLIALPTDYTKLHASVLSMCSFDLPALCLVCGAIVNSAGQGQCYMHAMACGEGVGVFFLVQECSIALCNGPRTSYFPSIYLDVYGEIHRSYRGKPLHLDRARQEALRSLWATFGVASEVIIKRSSASRVIINGYY